MLQCRNLQGPVDEAHPNSVSCSVPFFAQIHSDHPPDQYHHHQNPIILLKATCIVTIIILTLC